MGKGMNEISENVVNDLLKKLSKSYKLNSLIGKGGIIFFLVEI